MSFYTDYGVFTEEQVKEQYDNMLRKFNPNIGDIGFSWIQHAKDFSLYNLQEIIPQINDWRILGNIKAFDYNNNEFEVEGRKWYVLIVQKHKDGVMEEGGLCPVSMLLFGSFVDGFTYAFAKESDRDLVFRLINAENDNELRSLGLKQTSITKPTCAFCKKECENEFGNNSYPLAPKRVCEKGFYRCCNDCNRSMVLPARIEGQFRCEEVIDDKDKQVILDKCAVILVGQFQEIIAEAVKDLETKTPNDLLGDPIHSQFKDYPTIKSIDLKVKELRDRLNFQCIRSVGVVMEYVKKRFQSHLNIRSISSPKDICATTKTPIRQAFNYMGTCNQILTETKELQLDLQQTIDTIRKNIENELVSTQLPQTKQEDKKKDKVMTQQELTRQANKSKNQKEKERLEFEARVEEANRIKAEQEKKKKQQQAIAKKKREQKKLDTV